MTRLIRHIRVNAIAYCALFVALGGTSYAAVSIPRNSVGSNQLRNGSVTEKKLNRNSIPGYVAFWAKIYSSGRVLASSAPAKTSGWTGLGGNISFRGELPNNCFPVAAIGAPAISNGYVSTVTSSSDSGSTGISLNLGGNVLNGQRQALSVNVAEICP